MYGILISFEKAFELILSLNRELAGIVVLSLLVSGAAIVIASLLGIVFSYVLAFRRFPFKGFLTNLLNTSMGLPPVVVGLFLYLLLSRNGPLGFMGLLYTPSAMVIAQIILAFPIIAAMSHAAIVMVKPNIRLAALGLGATDIQASVAVIRDARYGIISSVMAGLGRVMAEVGAVLIVGGNIAGYTRVMTTTIALEYDKGNFELAIALGIILLLISLFLNAALFLFQRKVYR
ncbi:sulfate transport system permease protein CysW [bacterium BMS3Abin07]|nr:sulfate transport system permease protein CysW [bacterium BMS3Abin07]GBE32396.1 sulfate transport system permease protein CysW [bacterium BMS3Bbin05]HDO21832.1 ABC transporter permease subunit [Nitrospirota bacterium]HDZ88705.1 ABC transporter permease subunit [Nitrospirota bacterium]